MISRILPSALCLLLAPLLVAEQVHNDAQTAVSLDRVAVTGAELTLIRPIESTQSATPPMQSTSGSASQAAGNPVNGQDAKASVKSKKHHTKENISTALKRTGNALAFVALLPLFLVEWLLAIIICRSGCDL